MESGNRLNLITIFNFSVVIAVGNVKALCSEGLLAKSSLICICPSRGNMNH